MSLVERGEDSKVNDAPSAFPTFVSVIIPARNAGATIGSQLEALSRQQFRGAWEVIVVDNDSTDGTAVVSANWAAELPQLRVAAAAGRPSASRARNVGAAAARGDLLVFCDADDVATPGWLSAMVDAARNADVIGGQLDHIALNTAKARSWRPLVPADHLPNLLGFLPYASSASLGVRTEVFHRLGGFSKEYPYGGEEVEFCWRAQLASYTIGHAPTAVMSYRLRHQLRPLAKQAYGWGYSDAHLYQDFRRHGVPPASGRATLREWRQLIRRLPELSSRDRAGAWIQDAAWRCGRLVGSLRYRVFCP